MSRDLTPEEIVSKIELTKKHKASIDELGFGHRNVVVSIIVDQKMGETYCGQPISEDLFEKAQEIYNDWLNAQLDLDRFSIPNLDELRKLTGYNSHTILQKAVEKGLITDEQAQIYKERRQDLLQTVLRNRFVELGKITKELHEDYIDFLKKCLPGGYFTG